MPDNRFTFKVADVVRIVGEKVNNDHFQLLICKDRNIYYLKFTCKEAVNFMDNLNFYFLYNDRLTGPISLVRGKVTIDSPSKYEDRHVLSFYKEGVLILNSVLTKVRVRRFEKQLRRVWKVE